MTIPEGLSCGAGGGCALRLLRTAEEWGAGSATQPGYTFWSCSLITVVDQPTTSPSASPSGVNPTATPSEAPSVAPTTASPTASAAEPEAEGRRLAAADPWSNCTADSECGANGVCVPIHGRRATSQSPAARCFCQTGYFGAECAQPSALTTSWSDAPADSHTISDGDFSIQWSTNSTHVEVSMRVRTQSWAAIGWSPRRNRTGVTFTTVAGPTRITRTAHKAAQLRRCPVSPSACAGELAVRDHLAERDTDHGAAHRVAKCVAHRTHNVTERIAKRRCPHCDAERGAKRVTNRHVAGACARGGGAAPAGGRA